MQTLLQKLKVSLKVALKFSKTHGVMEFKQINLKTMYRTQDRTSKASRRRK